jgi:hypothetical protein
MFTRSIGFLAPGLRMPSAVTRKPCFLKFWMYHGLRAAERQKTEPPCSRTRCMCSISTSSGHGEGCGGSNQGGWTERGVSSRSYCSRVKPVHVVHHDHLRDGFGGQSSKDPVNNVVNSTTVVSQMTDAHSPMESVCRRNASRTAPSSS